MSPIRFFCKTGVPIVVTIVAVSSAFFSVTSSAPPAQAQGFCGGSCPPGEIEICVVICNPIDPFTCVENLGCMPGPVDPPPPAEDSYPPVTGTYPPVTGTYDPVTGTYPPVTGTYDPVTGTYPPVTGTYDPVTGTYDPVTGTYVPVTGTYDPVTGTYTPVTGTYEDAYDPAIDSYDPATGSYVIPSVVCTPPNSNVPAGSTVNFTAYPYDGAGPPYAWLDGSNNVLGTGGTYSQVFNSGGSVRVRANNGEGGTVVSGYCAVSISGGACTGAGPIAISANPSRIQQGGSTTLNWTGSNLAGGSCTVTNLNTSPATFVKLTTVAPAPSCNMTDSTTVSNIQNQTTFRLTCGSLTKDVIVNLVPKYEEF